MMPVMKNNYDIYKGRVRKTSEECSTTNCRSRKVSESSRSDGPSLSTSPSSTADFMSPRRHTQPIHMTHLANNHKFSRNSSRTSQSSLITSPTKSSPPKPSVGSQNSLNKFHTRLVDKLRKSLRRGNSTETTRS